MYVGMYACMYTCVPGAYLVPEDVRRGCQIPWNCMNGCEPHVGDGNRTLIFCKGN